MLNSTADKKLIFVILLCYLSGCGYSSTEATQGNSNGGSSGDNGSSEAAQEIQLPRLEELPGNPQFGYQGAFRIDHAEFGVSSANSAIGALAYNPDNHSLFIAGHPSGKAIAEFSIPELLDVPSVAELNNETAPLQNFFAPLDAVSNPDAIDRITGMLYLDGQLVVNAERWYDGSASANDTTLVIRDAQNMDASQIDGYYQLSSKAEGAGYMSAIPLEWQSAFRASYLTGWSSVYSINSRYSIGPSLWTFDPTPLLNDAGPDSGPVAATAFMNFPYSGDGETHIVSDAFTKAEGSGVISPVWNYLANGVYGFIVPDTRTFVVVGSSAGIESGIGYKITQDDGELCGGYCAYSANDYYNYYWLFDVNEILNAAEVHDPQPYAYGRLSVPFDNNGENDIVGGTFDLDTGMLYLTLSGAGKTGRYDKPPLIVVYRVSG